LGGLVFQPLTFNYLQYWGSDWQNNAPISLVAEFFNGKPTAGAKERIILNRVLADELNAGFQHFQNIAIKEINGQKIASLKDLIRAFESNQAQYHIIVTEDNQKITLDRHKVLAQQGSLLKKYFIGADRSLDLLEPAPLKKPG
jgi:hypothetical protein